MKHAAQENRNLFYKCRVMSYMNYKNTYVIRFITQVEFTCSKSTSKAPEQCVKYVQSSK